MTLYEQRVKRLHDHVTANKPEQKVQGKPTELTNKELMAALDELGVKYDKKDNKATLMGLLENAKNEDAE